MKNVYASRVEGNFSMWLNMYAYTYASGYACIFNPKVNIGTGNPSKQLFNGNMHTKKQTFRHAIRHTWYVKAV